MMRNNVETVHITEKLEPINRSIDSLRLIWPAGRVPRLLARLAWWTLKRYSIRALETKRSHATVSFDNDDLIKRIALSRKDLETLWWERADAILVGRDVMPELIRAGSGLGAPYAFDASADVVCDAGRRLLGVRVVFVPWMTGWVLLPKAASGGVR